MKAKTELKRERKECNVAAQRNQRLWFLFILSLLLDVIGSNVTFTAHRSYWSGCCWHWDEFCVPSLGSSIAAMLLSKCAVGGITQYSSTVDWNTSKEEEKSSPPLFVVALLKYKKKKKKKTPPHTKLSRWKRRRRRRRRTSFCFSMAHAIMQGRVREMHNKSAQDGRNHAALLLLLQYRRQLSRSLNKRVGRRRRDLCVLKKERSFSKYFDKFIFIMACICGWLFDFFACIFGVCSTRRRRSESSDCPCFLHVSSSDATNKTHDKE